MQPLATVEAQSRHSVWLSSPLRLSMSYKIFPSSHLHTPQKMWYLVIKVESAKIAALLNKFQTLLIKRFLKPRRWLGTKDTLITDDGRSCFDCERIILPKKFLASRTNLFTYHFSPILKINHSTSKSMFPAQRRQGPTSSDD